MTNEEIANLRALERDVEGSGWVAEEEEVPPEPDDPPDDERVVVGLVAWAGGPIARTFIKNGMFNARFIAAARDALPRLLDEREALLGALHGAFDALGIAGEGRFHQDALQAAGDAIRKAEAP